MIEYANIMNQTELSDFFLSITKKSNAKKSKAAELLIKHKEKLLEDHFKLEQERVDQYYSERKKLQMLYKAWKNKKCDGCGASLRIVFDQFWGCPNYNDKSQKHRTFPLEYDDQINYRLQSHNVRVDANWATNILRQNNLNAFASASDLLNFYEENGLDDLREKYGYKKTKERISGYVKAKKESVKEEREIVEHLSRFFPKGISQTGIRYKRKDQNEKVAIVDLILSDEKVVYVIEIKRSVLDINEDQLILYQSLIDFTLKNVGDRRICKALFIIYNDIPIYFPTEYKYILYDHIKTLKTKELITRIFDKNAI